MTLKTQIDRALAEAMVENPSLVENGIIKPLTPDQQWLVDLLEFREARRRAQNHASLLGRVSKDGRHHCDCCGFRYYRFRGRNRRHHAPDCERIWKIKNMWPNSDHWDWMPSFDDAPPITRDVPFFAELDPVPIWTRLDWDAIRGNTGETNL